MKKLLLILFILPLFVAAQRDTSFWFAAPDVNEFLSNNPHDKPMLLRLTTFSSAATVRISIPANPSFTPITRTIAANATSTVDLSTWDDLIENSAANIIADKGLMISSTADITAYYEVVSTCNCNPELFALKGRSALGNEFIIPSQKEWSIDSVRFPNARSAFNIIATENNTIVNITPTQPLIGRPAGGLFSITLNKGQSFSNQGLYRAGGSLLNGSIVTSNKPISITATEDLLMADGPCADLAGDQLIPTSIWGDEFVIIRGGLTNKDKVVITAMANGTSIFLNGSTSPIAIINRGASYESNLTQPTLYVKASQKVSIYHYTGINCEIGSAVIPKINCTGSNDVAITRSIDETAEVFIVTRQGNQSSFTVNGSSTIITASDFQVVPGSGGAYLYCRKNMNASMASGVSTRFINSMGKFSLGFLNGATPTSFSGCRYGYFSDFKSSSVSTSQVEICRLDSAQLTAFGGVTYQWSPAIGLTNTNIANPKASPGITTDYKVIITTIDGCIDSAFVKVIINSNSLNVSAGNPTSYCSNTTVTHNLSGTGNGTDFNWQPAALLNNNTVSNPVATISSTTKFYLTQTSPLGCSSIDSVLITINPLPVISTFPDTSFCANTNLTLTASGTASYVWSPANVVSNPNIANPIFTGTTNQTMTVIGTNALGCADTSSFNVTVKAIPNVTTIPDSTICNTSSIVLTTTGAQVYSWSPVTNLNNPNIASPVFSGSTGNTYTVTGTAVNGCTNTDVVVVSTRSPGIFNTPPDKSVCINGAVVLDGNNGNGVTYQWSPAASLSNTSSINPTATPAIVGNNVYNVLISESFCNTSQSFVVNVVANPLPSVVANSSNDLNCSVRTSTLSATGASSYVWSPAATLNNATVTSPIASPSANTTYTVVGTDINGCKNSATTTILVSGVVGNFNVPNTFTPNGDNINDCFSVRHWGASNNFIFSIYNRWGTKVFETKDVNRCWDGKIKGQPADRGNYVYFIKSVNACGEQIRKGNVLLIR